MAQDVMAPAAPRVDPRFPASAVPAISAVRLSPGDVVDLVNISRTGVLVEGRTRFVPGTRVTVIFEGTFGPPQHKGRVVRCQVSSISGGALRYQSGIQFDTRLDAHPGEIDPPAASPAPAARATHAAPGDEPLQPVRPLVNRW
jgi:hypothetical protein